MQAGRIQNFDRLEWKLTFTASRTRSGAAPPGCRASAGLSSFWTPNSATKSDGILLSIVTQDVSGGSPFGATGTEWTLEIPDLLFSATYTSGSWNGSTEVELFLEDVILYQQGGGWLLSVGSFDWSIDGTLKGGGGAFTLTGPLTPAGVPLVGIPPTLSSDAATDNGSLGEPINCIWENGGVRSEGTTGSDFTAFDESATVTTSATGGWHVKVGDTYHSFPVLLNPKELPSNACATPYSLPSATSTYDAATSAYATYRYANILLTPNWQCPGTTSPSHDVWREIIGSESRSNSVTLIPNFPSSVTRMGNDYAALIQRFALPEATRTASLYCCHHEKASGCATDEGEEQDITLSDALYTSAPLKVHRVTNAAHPVEVALERPIYAPYTASGDRNWYDGLILDLLRPLVGPIETCDGCYPFAPYRDFSAVNSYFPANVTDDPAIAPYLQHTDTTARLVNTCLHPGWSYFYYFPSNGNAAYWQVNGSKVNSDDYWSRLGEQYFDAPLLPVEETTLTRNFLLSAPLTDGALASFVGSAPVLGVGADGSWWGISRFDVAPLDPPKSLSLTSASAPLWSATGATLTHGASITVTPSTDPCTVDLDLGSFAQELRLYPHLCKRIVLNWASTNLAGMTVKLVTPDGSEVLLATTTGTYERTVDGEAKFAGSWAQDWDAGSGVTDDGADTDAAGVSSAVLADPERILAFLLLNTRTDAILRFELDVTATGVNCTLHYPTFQVFSTIIARNELATLVVENRQTTDILFQEGPGLRFGQWNCYSGGLVDPVVRPPGTRQTVLDWLVFNNLVLQGVDKATNVNTALAALYDATEGNSRADAASETQCFLVGVGNIGTAILVNSEREVPPLSCWPMQARDSEYALTTGWSNRVYSHAQETRYLVSGGSPLHLDAPSPRVRWTTSASSVVPSGWFATKHTHTVDNTEGDDHIVVAPDKDIATASPWHGYFGSYRQADILAGARCAAQMRGNVLVVAWQQGATLRTAVHTSAIQSGSSSDVGWLELTPGQTYEEVEAANVDGRPGLVMFPNRRLYLDYKRSGANKFRTVDSLTPLASDWSAAATPNTDISPSDNGRTRANEAIRVRVDSGTVKASVCREGRGAAWEAEATVATGARDDFAGMDWNGQQYCVLYIKDSDDSVMFVDTQDPASWGAATDTTLDAENLCGLCTTQNGTLVAIDWNSTSKRCYALRSFDRGATWEKDTDPIGAVPDLDTPPVLVSNGVYVLIVWVVDGADHPSFAVSTDCGTTWS